jgi:uncharacterized protein (DUF2062 family)
MKDWPAPTCGRQAMRLPEAKRRHREQRWARIRRLKLLLRFVPRRAALHRYPLVGRFAHLVRVRAYLWSFKSSHLRPAFYAGAVLAFWPVMGIQLPLAFAAALLLRANVMVMGALQFITNPFTAAPLYFGTYHLGRRVLALLGAGGTEPASPPGTRNGDPADLVAVDLAPGGLLTEDLTWTSSLGSTVTALFVGGTLCGLIVGGILDAAYRIGILADQRLVRHRAN